ncbi:hypothetical protein CGCFRS4_v015432 [Colletotrichum fructicola]|nr:hypothetical protein CGCFRS4_v015432 [Colletotrichum fructicola]
MDEASKAQKPVSRWKPHVTYVKTAGAVHRAATSIHPAPYAKYVTFDPFGPDDKDATLGVRTLSVLNTSTRSISSRVIVVNSSDDDGHSNTKEPVQSSQSIFYTKSDGHEIDSESPKASLVRHRKTKTRRHGVPCLRLSRIWIKRKSLQVMCNGHWTMLGAIEVS